MRLSDNIQYLKGIGEKRAELFHRLGIFTVRDLLFHLPRGLEDRTNLKNVSELIDGETVCVKGILSSGLRKFRARNGTWVLQTRMSDGTGIMQLTWFNALYVENTLADLDAEYTFFGKVSYRTMSPEMVNPIIERSGGGSSKMGRLVPVYPATAGLKQKNIRDAVAQALAGLSDGMTESLPEDLRQKYGLIGIDEAIRSVHMPESFDDFNNARRRLVFEEFLVLQLGVSMAKQISKSAKSVRINNVKCIAEFAAGLGFQLTGAQKRVINEIAADLKSDVPMSRLVQGDVGSGKTIVAAAAMFAAAREGHQSAMMAPTEILAEQHYKNLKNYFEPWGIKTVLLSGGQKAAERNHNLKAIESGEAKIIVGTHAIITEKVRFDDLVLSVTDEQHRFGVSQRSRLTDKGAHPHTLVMTATPIPRTLSLVIYGDLDISVIDELPPGRKPVKTVMLSEAQRGRLYSFVRSELSKGRQAYFVCALVDDSDAVSAKAASEYYKKLRDGVFKDKTVGLLHGRMKSFEKESVMRSFAEGRIDVLVATTVIEVGVDVPNATVMVIENTERFGLSQLHQLRGRVGRGAAQSYCIMLGNAGSGIARERMKVMCETNDGFKIAEKDLELRGPGDFFGTKQHGLPDMKIGNFFTDMDILRETRGTAEEILAEDKMLSSKKYAQLKKSITENFSRSGNILN
ncbi:MAG TPA: ATP-dependent DNA helicase RecG [Candidatus Monoglobus merdigallinarum]|uniref:ATP-dependent DNA helicase RecG n=1 Tax=Candidatus Monoglobus merdigallinarum TaxID=2838698 RepID=A0A9D1PRJ1_9FIRM|nr:ATP-dependent DNA helicase RecG [Candidatus Monoglobus merdigallinarum]